MEDTDDKQKIHLVSCYKFTAPKSPSGLCVGSIRMLKIGLIVKWWWHLKVEGVTLSGKIIKSIHNLNAKPYILVKCSFAKGSLGIDT